MVLRTNCGIYAADMEFRVTVELALGSGAADLGAAVCLLHTALES